MKFYAIAYDEAEAIKNCYTGKYTNQPFWPQYKTLLPYLQEARKENPSLRIFVIKVGR